MSELHAHARQEEPPSPLSQSYLLVVSIPYYVDEEGQVWLERLWHRDFTEHLRYLPRLTLAAPRYEKREAPEGADLLRVEVPNGAELGLVPLPKIESMGAAIARTPEIARRLYRAIGDADIVHSGVVGWPFPLGWIGNPIALARRRKLVVIVESAPWRASGADGEGAKHRVREVVTERLARFFVRRADLKLFTQPEYQRTLARAETPACFVTPASWINTEDVLTGERARAAWAAKRGEPVRLVFAGRLSSTKGVDVLLEALGILERRGVAARVDVIGEGPRRAACVEASLRLSNVRLSVLDPLPYGPPFFGRLAGYHAALVPSLGDEQPRILFDAYSQAVPVIAARTDGIAPYLEDGETGWLVARGDPRALADAIERAQSAHASLEAMGMRAVAYAPRFTHRSMHDERWRILVDTFGA